VKTLIITQARIGSSRLPEKVLMPVAQNQSLLEVHLRRLKRSRLANQVIVATTHEPKASEIIAIANQCDCLSYQGSENDVLDRFYQAVLPFQPQTVVRVTSDCPLNDGLLIDELLSAFKKSDYDYYANIHPPSYPDGMDVEVFRFSALEKAWQEAKAPKEREHVTPYIHQHENLFKLGNHAQTAQNDASIRLTVDHANDLKVIQLLVAQLGTGRPWTDYRDAAKTNVEILKLNQQFKRNEGY